jgi:hypothetical protein
MCSYVYAYLSSKAKPSLAITFQAEAKCRTNASPVSQMRTDAPLVLVKLEDLRIKRLDIGSGFRRSAMEVFPLLDTAWRRLVVGNYQPTFRATSQELLRLCCF